MARPEVQAGLQRATDTLPAAAGAYALGERNGWYVEHPAQAIAMRQLLSRKPTRESTGIRLGHFGRIRTIIDEELEAVWSGAKTPIDALNAAVQRGNAVLEAFAGGSGVRMAKRVPRELARREDGEERPSVISGR